MTDCCSSVSRFIDDSIGFCTSEETTWPQAVIGGIAFTILSVGSGFLFLGYQCYKHFWTEREVRPILNHSPNVARNCTSTQRSDSRNVSLDGQYTTGCYKELQNLLAQGVPESDYGVLYNSIKNEKFQKKYRALNGKTPIVVPRLDFLQTQNYSPEDLEWIKKFVCYCLGRPNRNPDFFAEDFAKRHLYAYTEAIMKMEQRQRAQLCVDIINLVLGYPQGSSIDSFGNCFLRRLSQLYNEFSPQFYKQFYTIIYSSLKSRIDPGR